MKKPTWLMLVLFSAASAYLRFVELRDGFDAQGLPAGGAISCVLPLLLVIAAAAFVLSARSYPAQRELCGEMEEYFDFSGTLGVMLCVLGAFALFAAAAVSLLFSLRTTLTILLAVFLLAAGASVLYVLFSLRRGNALSGVVVLTPVYALVLYLIFVYRTCAVDPVLGNFYVDILALAALTMTFLEFSAFVFRNGAPRIFVPLAAMSVVLCICAAVKLQEPAVLLLYLGFVLILLGYCTAARFRVQ